MKHRLISNAKEVVDALHRCGYTEYILSYELEEENPILHEISTINENKIKRITNTRSAGFYVFGTSIEETKSVLLIDSKNRGIENILSPLSEAFYQDIKLVVVLFITDGCNENIDYSGELYETIDIYLTEKDKNEDYLYGIISNSERSLVLRVFRETDSKEKLSRFYGDPGKQDTFVNCIKNLPTQDYDIVVASDFLDDMHISQLMYDSNIKICNNRGYGVLSYFVGKCLVSQNKLSILVVDTDYFFADMNALWIRGANHTNSIIVVTIRDMLDANHKKVTAWASNLRIKIENDFYHLKSNEGNENLKIVIQYY